MRGTRWAAGGLLAGLILGGSLSVAAVAEGRILVAASIAPLADFTRQVGGDRVEVITLIPPGARPHTYVLDSSQVAQVARAHLLILNGAGLEHWSEKLVKALDNPRLEVVDTSEGMPLLGAGARGITPHVWLDPQRAMLQVWNIRCALVRADPQHAAVYRANAIRFLAELGRLDREIAARVATWTTRQFISFNPAWVYFASRYGLEQAAVVECSAGREPSPGEMVRIVATARQIGARPIFAERHFSPTAAEVIARECGAPVLLLDPLGSSPDASGYLAMMRHNVAHMAMGLQ